MGRSVSISIAYVAYALAHCYSYFLWMYIGAAKNVKSGTRSCSIQSSDPNYHFVEVSNEWKMKLQCACVVQYEFNEILIKRFRRCGTFKAMLRYLFWILGAFYKRRPSSGGGRFLKIRQNRTIGSGEGRPKRTSLMYKRMKSQKKTRHQHY